MLRRRQRCLLRQAQTDPEAFAAFYDAYAKRVTLFLTWRLKDAERAFDLMSETFAKALENRHQFRGTTEAEEQAWLYTIARRELSHYWRRGSVERAAMARLGIPAPAVESSELRRIEELAEIADLREQLTDALNDLPADQQRALQLRIVEEHEYPEIASRLAVSEDVVRARVSRGLRALRRSLPEAQLVWGDGS